ncbi:hypothetical protein ANOM_004133 [Aspergillus nomiae NRRL 13137]|uniref:DUF3533 domain-containing protein n=1 Tax=Aspergillus nomiae NRRL (strain ATCC 15546 / NRRL 13137 / CBS 260.88 / M93) TaxID=1509407 RepID=A0A0L1J7L7_ASPN3|nr:uncharacterized protein ANOM_004133 [Aspergillus nomiae NRRL 13137]KNG87670.1 hypothetical protein ANOM_004133 [Aspergillus nomiae NRRL 13137]
MHFYPKARHQPHPSIHDPFVRRRRLGLLKAAGLNFIVLQLLFLGLFCYLFGSLFQQTTHIHNLHVVFVDYDGGAVGGAVRTAYEQLKGPGFPTLSEQSVSAYPQPSTVRSAVCNIDYWGGLYTSVNASNRLAAAFGGGSAAASYNNSDILTLVWNEARYPTTADSAIAANMQSLSEAARVAYSQANGMQALTDLNGTDPAAIAAFTNPWTLASINIQPTTQGSRLIYNTLVIILILIQEFFFLGYINGLYQQFQLYLSIAAPRIATVRQLISGLYTLSGSLCTTGAIWAFRHGWNVNGGQFALTWMALWLFAHCNFLVLDVFTIWLPPPGVPMALISWIVLNITSILLPFELSPGFYQWGYALPAHSIFQVLVDIWSGGCNPQLDYALPVLFAYELIALTLSSVGVYRRAHYAVLAKETEEKTWKERVAAAISEQQQQQMLEETPTPPTSDSALTEGEQQPDRTRRRSTAAGIVDQEALTGQLWREMSRLDKTPTGRQSTGPCFDLPFTD